MANQSRDRRGRPYHFFKSEVPKHTIFLVHFPFQSSERISVSNFDLFLNHGPSWIIKEIVSAAGITQWWQVSHN